MKGDYTFEGKKCPNSPFIFVPYKAQLNILQIVSTQQMLNGMAL